MAYPTHGPEYHERDPWKLPCRAATTATITIATALNDGDTLDGVTLATGDRVLVKNQSTSSQNGIWIVGASPTRAIDFDSEQDIVGAVVVVREGTTNADTVWLSSADAPVTVGTTALTFVGLGIDSITAHLSDATDAHDASAISFTPAGTIAATDVQAAIEEVAAEAGGGGGGSGGWTAVVGGTQLETGRQNLIDQDNDASIFLDGWIELDGGASAGITLYPDDDAWVEIPNGLGLVLPSQVTEPSGVTDGHIYYNSVLDKIRLFAAGAWVDLSTGVHPGLEYDYVQITSGVNPTATTEATANTIVTANAVTYDGSTTIMLIFDSPNIRPTNVAAASIIIVLYDNGSSIGHMGQVTVPAASFQNTPVHLERRLTPSSGSHTFSIRAYVTGGTGLVQAGAGGSGNTRPAYIRQVRV